MNPVASAPSASLLKNPETTIIENGFSVMIPYYNEAKFIAGTLLSILQQKRLPDQIILVDNASSDGSEAICRDMIRDAGYAGALFLREDRPGKTNALETGCRHINREYVAICDADTYYPPHYLELAGRLFKTGGSRVVAVMAQCVDEPPETNPKILAQVRETVRSSRIFTSKCFAGGAGQIFRTRALLEAGGFSEARWKYVLEDHEIMHRVHKLGRSLYHEDLWCLPADRRTDRAGLSWNLMDRMLYRYTPKFLGDWFFYHYLGPAFEKRRMISQNLREQPWADKTKNGEGPAGVP